MAHSLRGELPIQRRRLARQRTNGANQVTADQRVTIVPKDDCQRAYSAIGQIGRTSMVPVLAPGQRAAHEIAASMSGTLIM